MRREWYIAKIKDYVIQFLDVINSFGRQVENNNTHIEIINDDLYTCCHILLDQEEATFLCLSFANTLILYPAAHDEYNEHQYF